MSTHRPGHRIVMISKSIDDAATRYRANILKPELERQGWRIAHVNCDQPWYRTRILLAALQSDLILIQRKLLGPLFFQALRALGKRIVFDFDDAIFLKSSGKPSGTRSTRFATTAQACALMLAGNRYLAAEAGKHCGRVEIVPTGICLADYPATAQAGKSGPELVWIGSSSTRKYLEQHRDVFAALAAAFPGLKLKIIADFDWPDCPMPCEAVRWTRDGEVPALQAALIGIAPMPDNPWTRGKCALKVLQYMAAGLPVVSSNAGANAEVIEPGNTGFLANAPQQWVDAIGRLLADKALREQMGQAGRLRVEQHYAQEVLVPRIVAMLDTLVS